MNFTKIQGDIIRFVLESNEDPNCAQEPCIEQLQTNLMPKYTLKEIEGNVLKLIARGVFEPYSFQFHLRFTERFTYMNEYKRFMNSLSYMQEL